MYFHNFFYSLRYALTTFDLLASLQCLLGREDARTAVTALLVKTGLKQLFFSLFCVHENNAIGCRFVDRCYRSAVGNDNQLFEGTNLSARISIV